MKSRALLILAPAVMLASCAKEPSGIDARKAPTGEAVRFSIDTESLSRAATGNDFKTVFEEGDEIGLFVVSRSDGASASLQPSGNYADNVMIRFTNGVWEYDSDELFFTDSNVWDVYAYYPYRNGVDPTAIVYDTGAAAYDLMTARSTDVSQTDNPITLVFRHKLALIEVNTEGLAEAVTILGARCSATLDLSAADQDDELTTVPDQTTNIELSAVSASKFRTFIPPQEIAAGDVFVIQAQGNSPKYTTEAVTQFKSGVARQYTISTGLEDWGKYPNSFIVVPGGSVTIPVKKAFGMWRESAMLKDIPGVDLTGALTAGVVWQDTQGLIPASDGITLNLDEPTPENSTITVKTDLSKGKGNAVVFLKIGGTIRWSWHIWVVDYDPATDKTCPIDHNADGAVDFILMDRNLGATTSTLGAEGVLGFMYQWGRKDPFPGIKDYTNNLTSNAEYQDIYDIDGNAISVADHLFDGNPGRVDNTSTRDANAVQAFTNPISFITNSGNADWYNASRSMADENDTGRYRWVAKVTGGKTAYDPCPEGWMVARSPDVTTTPADLSGLLVGKTTFNAEGLGRESAEYGNWPLCGRIFNNGVIYRGTERHGSNAANIRAYGHTAHMYSETTSTVTLSTLSYFMNNSTNGFGTASISRNTGAFVRCTKQ